MYYSDIRLVGYSMTFINADGKSISFECSELIEELKQDISEFGGEKIVVVWCKEYEGVILYINYDFITEDEPLKKNELKDGEFLKQMTMSALLHVLEKQNSVL